ncbi:hypothetical protein [Streptococcus mitis]|uniref:hypothetical protein n=1 Tax=Streptococcus mitis TaxID=28037 RepID=UPI0021B803E5|nr:hypothetical protein [Streptococcus mitis]
MKKQLTPIEYIFWLLIESVIFLFLFKFVIDLVIYWNPQTTLRDTLVFSVASLGFVYLIIKIIAQKYSNQVFLSMLPVSYLLGFYVIYFSMFLEHTTTRSDYTEQLALFTLFFTITKIIDKIIDNFIKNSKEN